MKKQLLVTLLSGVAATGAFAQGTIAVDNLNNSAASSTATTSGLFFESPTGLNPVLANDAWINITVLGGSSASSLSPIVTLTGATGFVNGGGAGQFADFNGAAYLVPGVASQGTAFLEVEAWTGSAATYSAAANTPGSLFGTTAVFQNPTGGPGTPPVTPQDLVGMPALVLTSPEPSTIALGGLGAAALMFFRRRK